MQKKLETEAKMPLSAYIGPIKVKEQGVQINGKSYPQAIGIIGGATGLEVLNAAREFPEAAIVVVDPLAYFARNIITQLTRIEAGKQKPQINWDFFLKKPGPAHKQAGLIDIKWELDNPTQKATIEDLFLSFTRNVHSNAPRIKLVAAFTSQVTLEEALFDGIRMFYPYPHSRNDKSIYEFIAKGLRIGGKFELITESVETAYHFHNFGGVQVESCGGVERYDGIKKPVSLYDLALGMQGYQYVNIRKQSDLILPNTLKLFMLDALPFSIIPLYKMVHGKKYQKNQE